MSDSYLLVPGTGGTKLFENGVDIGYPVELQLRSWLAAKLRMNQESLRRLLSMEHRPGQHEPFRTTLNQGATVTPGPVLTVAYHQVPANFIRFSYDWRADMRYSARQLLELLKTRGPRTRGGRWNLITHSQGGLLAIIASKMYALEQGQDATAFSRLVRKILFVGVPLHGTLNSAHALVHGEQLGKDTAPYFKRVVRTWPAIYQMLPAWPGALRDASYEPVEGGFFLRQNWSGILPNASEDLLARARETRRQYLDHPMDDLADVGVAFIMSRNRATWSYAVQSDDAIGFPDRSSADPSDWPAGVEEGDSLVAFQSTHDAMRSLALDGQSAALVRSLDASLNVATHSMLLTDEDVGSLCRAFLS